MIQSLFNFRFGVQQVRSIQFLKRALRSIVQIASTSTCLLLLQLTVEPHMHIHAQSSAQATVVQLYSQIAIPTPSNTAPGTRNASALQELVDHLAAVGGGSWQGMQGTGTITYGPQGGAAFDATLSNRGHDKFRLDAQTKNGPTSTRVRGVLGKIEGRDGRISQIPPETAMAGIFPFEILRMPHLAGQSTSLIDRGTANIEGTQLHRISLEIPSIGRNPRTKGPNSLVIDYYFDPVSHLLMKSADSVILENGERAKLLSVVSYSDYRMVGTVLVPFRFTETLEGQQSRDLQLTNVQLNPSFATTYFEF